jgi:hypothetical protein
MSSNVPRNCRRMLACPPHAASPRPHFARRPEEIVQWLPVKWTRGSSEREIAGYSSETRKRRFASECVVGLEGLERPNRRL